MNNKKVAAAIGNAGRALVMLSEGMMEGETMEIDARDVGDFARAIADALKTPADKGDQNDE